MWNVITQTKRDTLFLQIKGWVWGWKPHLFKEASWQNITTLLYDKLILTLLIFYPKICFFIFGLFTYRITNTKFYIKKHYLINWLSPTFQIFFEPKKHVKTTLNKQLCLILLCMVEIKKSWELQASNLAQRYYCRWIPLMYCIFVLMMA